MIKTEQTEAANRHITTWAWKRAGDAAEGSTGLSSNRVDVSLGTVPTDCSKYSRHSIAVLERGQGRPELGLQGRLMCPTELGLGEVLSLTLGPGSVNRARSCEKGRWHSIEGYVNKIYGIFSEPMQTREPKAPGGTGKDCVHGIANGHLCGSRARETMLGGNSSVAVGDSLLWEGLYLLT